MLENFIIFELLNVTIEHVLGQNAVSFANRPFCKFNDQLEISLDLVDDVLVITS